MNRLASAGAAGIASSTGGLEHMMRRLGTGFLFAVFGFGAVLVAGVAFPLLAVRKRGVERELAAQRLVHTATAAFVALGTALRLFELRERGAARLAAVSGLVLANHPTLLDVVFLLSRMPQADCIVKSEAWHNPFLRSVMRATGYIPNEGGAAVIDACVERLAAGRTVIIFPEGTRSPKEGIGSFRRGAARVALRSGRAITPVVVSCEPSALRKDQAWWDVPNQKLRYRLDVGRPLPLDEVVPGAASLPPALAARAFTAALRDYFAMRVIHAER